MSDKIQETQELKVSQPQVDSLTSKEAVDFSKDVAKDVGKQTIVWVLAAFLTNGIRNAISKVVKK